MKVKYDWLSGMLVGKIILTGKSFIENSKRFVEIICECGNISWMNWMNIKQGQTNSCGCLKKSILGNATRKHGLTNHPLYFVWSDMRQRCLNENDPHYAQYGGNGVKICKEWDDFHVFYEWAISHGWSKGLELDKDKLSPDHTGTYYSPEFCSFITHQENCGYTSRNRLVEYNGVKKILSQWCLDFGLNYHTARRRIFVFGWSVENTFNPPIGYVR